MHFLIETSDQLKKLKVEDSCFLQIVTSNHCYHPKLTDVSFYYYRNSEKGYVLSVKHSETMSIKNQDIKNFIAKHNKVYVLDRKFHSYFLDPKNLLDLYYTLLGENGNVNLSEYKTDIQINYERKFSNRSDLNEIIPVCKHYESLENLYSQIKDYVSKTEFNECLNNVDDAYQYVEQNPIGINDRFFDVYDLQSVSWSKSNNSIFTRYNLYNQTGRPTNTFNGVNFLAIQKNKEHRDCIVPLNDYFVEFDFDGYHVRLIANEIGYELPNSSVHEYFGKMYFEKDGLTEEEYKSSKTITFKQLYGGVMEEYKNLKFFHKMNEFIESMNLKGTITFPTGLKLKVPKDMTKIKLFNYYVQNLETKVNSEKILNLQQLLKGKKTKLVLITYDAFLFDFNVADGKELLIDIKSIMEHGDYPTKHKYGNTYFL